jgi:hypothetical protein
MKTKEYLSTLSEENSTADILKAGTEWLHSVFSGDDTSLKEMIVDTLYHRDTVSEYKESYQNIPYIINALELWPKSPIDLTLEYSLKMRYLGLLQSDLYDYWTLEIELDDLMNWLDYEYNRVDMDFYITALSDDFYMNTPYDVYDVDYENIAYEYDFDDDSEALIEEYLANRIEENGIEIDSEVWLEMSLKEKVEEIDTEWDISNCINQAASECMNDEYAQEVKRVVIDALSEYGDVSVSNHTGEFSISTSMDTLDIHLPSLISDMDYIDYTYDELLTGDNISSFISECMYNGHVARPNFYGIDSRYEPDVDRSHFNNTFRDLLDDRL